MSWQDDEIKNRKLQELLRDQENKRQNVVNSKIRQLWDRLLGMNASLRPELRLRTQDNILVGNYGPRGLLYPTGLEWHNYGRIDENQETCYLSWDYENEAYFVGQLSFCSGSKFRIPMGQDMPTKRLFYIEDSDIEHILKNLVTGKQPLDIYSSTLGNEPTINLDGIAVCLRSLQFFEGPSELPGWEQRVFKTHFSKSTSRFIYWLAFFVVADPIDDAKEFTIEQRLECDGEVINADPVKAIIVANSNSSVLCGFYGREAPGEWPKGVYTLALAFRGDRLGSRSFEISDLSCDSIGGAM